MTVYLKYGSVCSGIEAATVAWDPLNFIPMWFSEIEKFPCAVLEHHYPFVPNLGDMTKLHENKIFQESEIDVLVGGTPCQSFSVAGLRKGLDDPRGNLCLEFLRLVDIKRPRWFVWENVPGVLSSTSGRDFGAFLGAIQQLGYGFAYRILDAQYFGVPQRRRRVFVVGYLGNWRPAAAVLFERESLSGHIKASRKTRKDAPAFTPGSIGGYREGFGTLRAAGGDLGGGSEILTFDRQSVTMIHQPNSHVRRLTPRECERLQGFPDDYTLLPIKKPADGPRYKALGNSMAVPVMRWIGRRIRMVEEILQNVKQEKI